MRSRRHDQQEYHCRWRAGKLQRDSFATFCMRRTPVTDWWPTRPSGLAREYAAARPLALAAYPVGVEQLQPRAAACGTNTGRRCGLQRLHRARARRTGYRGFYYHFSTCRPAVAPGNANCRRWRAPFCWPARWRRELLWRGHGEEGEIRALADELYRRADWQWAQNHGATLTHGWTPENGFLKCRREGYDEALLLYVLGLGSPDHPLPQSSYAAWASTYQWQSCYGQEYLYAGPLFTHQLSHVWIDYAAYRTRQRGKGIEISKTPPRDVVQHKRDRHSTQVRVLRATLLGNYASDGPRSRIIEVQVSSSSSSTTFPRLPTGPDAAPLHVGGRLRCHRAGNRVDSLYYCFTKPN